MKLSPLQVRVLGVLMEKEKTTPDQYPLSLNALTTGCNQKSSREPVMALTESEVQNTIDELKQENLVADVLFGGRVPKYKHRFCNTEFSELQLSRKEQSLICVLFLRGAQTAGELRTRTQRMCDFSNVTEVENTLNQLIHRDGEALVKLMGGVPGKRELRFTHSFDEHGFDQCDSRNEEEHAQEPSLKVAKDNSKIQELESEIAQLNNRVEALEAAWKALNS